MRRDGPMMTTKKISVGLSVPRGRRAPSREMMNMVISYLADSVKIAKRSDNKYSVGCIFKSRLYRYSGYIIPFSHSKSQWRCVSSGKEIITKVWHISKRPILRRRLFSLFH